MSDNFFVSSEEYLEGLSEQEESRLRRLEEKKHYTHFGGNPNIRAARMETMNHGESA